MPPPPSQYKRERETTRMLSWALVPHSDKAGLRPVDLARPSFLATAQPSFPRLSTHHTSPDAISSPRLFLTPLHSTPLHSTPPLLSTSPPPKTNLSQPTRPYHRQSAHVDFMTTDIQNLKSFDPFAEADDNGGETHTGNQQNYIHIRIQQRNGRKTLTTVQGLPKKFDQKKILKVIKKKFACNGTVVADSEMGEVIQLQGDQRKDVQDFLTDKKEGLGLDGKTIKVHGF
ncbi:hypothetical protein IAQ61_010356 [Plenodomus lingam]|uniref:SUI1 domain-containing protein n=1 Tax=Leptosphaeria maculans (strain JN3 / isolate v23.1.3 / race Av1-4-5-6-7-8) TaxID=985895 RepID=E5A3P4_LEPMJ|nr:hypothetical protein LEMA_P096660.1 [Plenodomus lingam JN3]KAH9862153.1 hypothetical protein IAQ61_010356 [Plenodomus lingam]CBX98257.1 hypothetical protein LEMA_P096660.1 [Plenodomus lingam JN3]